MLFAAGEKEEVVKVAFIAPFTGGNAQQGINGRNGFELAINEANQSGEFPYRIELMALDDGSVPEQGVTAAQKACSDPQVVAAAGHFNSPVALATAPVFHESGVAMIVWSAIHPDITEKYGAQWEEISRICTTLITETEAFFDWVVDDLGYNNFSVISDTTTYGKGCLNYFMDDARKRNVRVASVDEINVGETDFMAILTKIKGLSPLPQALYFGGVVTEGALIRKQMLRAGLTDMLYSAISGIDSENYNDVAGESAEGTVIIGKGRAEELKKWPLFVEKYEKAGYKEAISARTVYGYDAAGIILQALKEVGPDREKMIDAIRNIEYEGIFGTYAFDEKGQTTLAAVTRLVSQDGDWVLFEKSKYATGERKLPGK
ncbi:MAG: branched-chain amino acid ABC transporter substrate-binding protein [Spirochaetes bacterium]|nr:MAG: branched-chain amino acid ABC transporter substrate-binding protein [Spirochaetota bacterium]